MQRLVAIVLLAAVDAGQCMQVVVDPSSGIVTPTFLSAEQQFYEQLAKPHYSASQMDYIDGASSSVLRHPYTILHAGLDELYVASFTLNHVVQLRWLSGKRAQYKVFASGKELDGPVGMALHGGALFIASFTNDMVLRVNATSGNLLGRIGSDETLDCPEGIAIGPDGVLYVASFLLPHLSRFDPESGAFLGKFGSAASSSAMWPNVPPASAPASGLPPPRKVPGPALRGAEDLVFDLNGDVHVSAYYSNAVFKFNGTSGQLVGAYVKGLVHGPVGITCDPSTGHIFVSSYRDHQVLRFSSNGQFVGVAAGAPLEQARQRGDRKAAIRNPSAVAFAEDGTLWVASYPTGAITRFNSSAASGRTWKVVD